MCCLIRVHSAIVARAALQQSPHLIRQPLCYSIAGNLVELVTITDLSPDSDSEANAEAATSNAKHQQSLSRAHSVPDAVHSSYGDGDVKMTDSAASALSLSTNHLLVPPLISLPSGSFNPASPTGSFTLSKLLALPVLPRAQRPVVIFTSRIHPGPLALLLDSDPCVAGESNASWVLQGLLEFLCGESDLAKQLLKRAVFKIVPMLNPDGGARSISYLALMRDC